MSEKQGRNQGLAPEQQLLNDLWEKHLREEFTTHDTNATLDTMVPNAYVNHIPVLTGGVGPAWRTGNPCSRYCPGGSLGSSRPRPVKPRVTTFTS